MSREQELLALWSKIIIGSLKNAAAYMAALGIWKAGASALNNSGRALRHLKELGQLEDIGGGVYRWPGYCRSEWGDHAKNLTQDLIRILGRYPQSQVRREAIAKAINRRADALVLIRRGPEAACLWLETVVTQRDSSIAEKKEVVETWPGALEFLSLQFAVEIPSFTFVTTNDLEKILED